MTGSGSGRVRLWLRLLVPLQAVVAAGSLVAGFLTATGVISSGRGPAPVADLAGTDEPNPLCALPAKSKPILIWPWFP